MRQLVLVAFLIALVPGGVNAAGTVDTVWFFSDAMGEDRVFQIYLPEGYNPDMGRRYPVVYFLHGATWTHEHYPFIPELVDDLISSDQISPVIVVKPNSNSGILWGVNWYTSSVLNGDIEGFIVNDLVDYVDAHYRTIRSRHHRAIAGHSMGGYGCMSLALKYSGTFGATAALAGHHDWTVTLGEWLPHILNENGGESPYDYFIFAGDWTLSTFTGAASFSPNLDNPWPFADFPLNSDGEIDPVVFSKWLQHDPTYLASAKHRQISIYFDCGTQDEYMYYPANVSFAETLDGLGMPYEFYSFEGDHIAFIEDRVARAITWLDAMRYCEDGDDFTAEEGGLFPNQGLLPGMSTAAGAQLNFALAQSAQVEIAIYDISGRLTRHLVDRMLPGGEHSVLWNGQDDSGQSVAAGVYLSRLQMNGKYVDSGKIIMVK